ncbi:MAG TPA: DUF4166 domain-containing protein [Rudaea sp.]
MTSIFAQLLGPDRFAQLGAPLRRLHEATQTRTHVGIVEVERGRGWIARFCAWAADLPPDATAQRIAVEIAILPDAEIWKRHFGDHVMRSHLRRDGALLAERLGLVRFLFELDVIERRLVWRIAQVRALGVPLPRRWFDGVRACEFESDGVYRFDVKVRLPMIGPIVHYHGYLDVG